MLFLLLVPLHFYLNKMANISTVASILRPVRRIFKRGVQNTAWPLEHGEGKGAGSFYSMDDLECQNFIQIYREKITETIDLSSPSFLDASVKTFTNIIYIKFSLVVDVVFLLAFTTLWAHPVQKSSRYVRGNYLASKGLKCYAFVCIYTRRCVYTSTSTTCIL